MTEATDQITEEYLLGVIKRHGEQQEIMSTNCGGDPKEVGDYAIRYGKAGDLLKRVRRGESLLWC